MQSLTTTGKIQQQLQISKPVQDNDNIIEVREKDFDAIFNGVKELNMLQHDMNNLLVQQEPMIDRVMDNVDRAQGYMKEGHKSLVEVEIQARSSTCTII